MSVKKVAETLDIQIAVVAALKVLAQTEGPLTYSQLSEYAEGLLREAAKQAQDLPAEEPQHVDAASYADSLSQAWVNGAATAWRKSGISVYGKAYEELPDDNFIPLSLRNQNPYTEGEPT